MCSKSSAFLRACLCVWPVGKTGGGCCRITHTIIVDGSPSSARAEDHRSKSDRRSSSGKGGSLRLHVKSHKIAATFKGGLWTAVHIGIAQAHPGHWVPMTKYHVQSLVACHACPFTGWAAVA